MLCLKRSIIFALTLFMLVLCWSTAHSDICATIDQYQFEKQENFRAYMALVHCGRISSASVPILTSPNQDLINTIVDAALGGVDQDIVLPDGTGTHVTQSETQIWAQGNTIVSTYNDSRTASACYAGGSYSLDGGATWTLLSSRPFCSGHGTNYGDPVVVYDKKHAHWVAVFLATGCGGQGIGAWTSTDGVTWSASGCAHNGGSDDRESGWVDNNATSAFYGRVYVSWNDFTFANANIFVTHSDDGGATWSSPVQVESNPAFIRDVQVTVGTDGTVFIAGMDEGGGGLSNRLNYVYRSTNGGTSWFEVPVGASFPAVGTSTCGYFAAMFPSYWRHMGWGDVGAANGVTHYAYAQHGAGSDPGDVYYVRSTNNGQTWNTPIKLNTDSTTRAQWQPSLSVSPAGHVFVSWYDARNTTGNSYERWGRSSTDNGATWGADDVISDVVSPLPAQPDTTVQPCYAGDYDRSFADGTAYSTTWVDGRQTPNNPQQDVFADKLPDSGGPPPTLTLTASGFKSKGVQEAHLSWTPTIGGDTVHVIRNGNIVATVPDNGAYTDNTGVKGPNGTYNYQVCVVETGECSNTVTVKFGKG